MTIDFIDRPLWLAHDHQPGEPANGYAARLAVVNGRTMRQFLTDMALPVIDVARGNPDAVAELARLGGADAEELMRCTPRVDGDDHDRVLNGERLGRGATSHVRFRFCPLCVIEDLETFPGPREGRPWLRLAWTIAHFRSCDRHHVHLVPTSPGEGRFEHFDFSQVMAGYLDDIEDLAAAAVPAAPSPYQAWLMDRIDGRRDPGNWLDRFPLHVAAEWCETLGVSALHPPKVMTTTLGDADWAAAADVGFGYASQGEDGIHELLTRLNDAQKDTRGYLGLRDTYGQAWYHLQRTIGDPAYAPIRDLVRAFADTTIPIEPGTDVLGVVIDEPKVLSVRTAAQLSGTHDNTMRKLVARQGLAPDAIGEGRRNHRVTVSRDEIGGMVGRLKGSLTTPEVREAYGIPRTHMPALIEKGYLRTATGSANHYKAKHKFARADVEDMLSRAFAGAEEVDGPDGRRMTLFDARKAACTTAERLVEMTFEDELSWKGRIAGRDDYGALLVDVDDVITHVRVEAQGEDVPLKEAMSRLVGFTDKALTIFMEHGVLEKVMQFSPDARREIMAIRRESLERFLRDYVTLGSLAAETGKHARTVKKILDEAGVEPAFDREVYRIFVFDRARAEAALA